MSAVKISPDVKQIIQAGCEAVLHNMPDPVEAKRSIWLKYMEEELKIGDRDIIVGHSSGAVAALRYAETRTVGGIVLVGAYASHLDDDLERARYVACYLSIKRLLLYTTK